MTCISISSGVELNALAKACTKKGKIYGTRAVQSDPAILQGIQLVYLSCKEGHAGAIHPGIVSSCRHGSKVVLSLGR